MCKVEEMGNPGVDTANSGIENRRESPADCNDTSAPIQSSDNTLPFDESKVSEDLFSIYEETQRLPSATMTIFAASRLEGEEPTAEGGPSSKIEKGQEGSAVFEHAQCDDGEAGRVGVENPQAQAPTSADIEQQQQLPCPPEVALEIGDHVYEWKSFVGIPGVFQHHGIVIEVNDTELKIADFSCILRTPGCDKASGNKAREEGVNLTTQPDKNPFGLRPRGVLRVYSSDPTQHKWHKVHYSASYWKMSLWRSGTCTSVKPDPPAKTLARVFFLLEHPEILPAYHVFQANCECVAVWCKTGQWGTLQASAVLSMLAAGQAKQTGTIAAYAAAQQVTVQVPASGFWGYFGYTTASQVSWLSLHPYALPALAAYGLITAGGPTMALWSAKSKWQKTSELLNAKFWDNACRDPDIFARSMFHWSERHEAFER